jgi:hypothetical protein
MYLFPASVVSHSFEMDVGGEPFARSKAAHGLSTQFRRYQLS